MKTLQKYAKLSVKGPPNVALPAQPQFEKMPVSMLTCRVTLILNSIGSLCSLCVVTFLPNNISCVSFHINTKPLHILSNDLSVALTREHFISSYFISSGFN